MPTVDSGRPESQPPPPGLLQSLKTYLRTWLELFRTRLELFATEIEEEKERVQEIAVLGLTSFCCLALGLLLLTLFVVVCFWETRYRLPVLGGFAVFYLAVGASVAALVRKKARTKPKIFSATLGELAKDYKHLSS